MKLYLLVVYTYRQFVSLRSGFTDRYTGHKIIRIPKRLNDVELTKEFDSLESFVENEFNGCDVKIIYWAQSELPVSLIAD